MKRSIKKNLLIVIVFSLGLISCECWIQCNMGSFMRFAGFWKLKEIQDTNGKITIPTSNFYFFEELYGDINTGKPLPPLSKDSIIFYSEKIPTMATAIKNRLETNEKKLKAVSLLDNGVYISLQNVTDGTYNYLEIRRANTLDSLSENPIERYVSLGARKW